MEPAPEPPHPPAEPLAPFAPAAPSTLRAGLFRLAFATVAGAAVAQGVTALWPAPIYDAHAIGFAVWAHNPPGLQTVFYLAFLLGGWAAYAAAPVLLGWAAGRTATAATAAGAGWAPWVGWLWVAAALVLPWQAEQAGKLSILIGFIAGLDRWLRALAASPVRWQRAQLGLGVAAIGYGAGLCALDIFPGPTRGMLNWYNPVLCGGTLVAVLGFWWWLGRRLDRGRAEGAGYLVSAWYLLPVGGAPLLSFAFQAGCSPWGPNDGGSRTWLMVAMGLFAVVVALLGREMIKELEMRLGGADAAGGTTEASAHRFLNRVAWVIVPLLFFAMAHERNLRMIGFSHQGLPFDFMHWGEWWDPWWQLQTGGKLWVDVYPLHGVGYDIGPCWLAAWLGDATLSGRFLVTAVLNGLSFVLFYLALLAVSRRRSVALFAWVVMLWDQPSWYKVWIGDVRMLPLFAWALALIGLARALEPAGEADASQPAGYRRGFGLWVAAALVGLLPLANFLTSVDVGYVTLLATAFCAAALIIGGARFGGAGPQARRAGGLVLAALVLSSVGFALWLGDRWSGFFDYHRRVFADKGWFDSLPLGFAELFTPVKAIYVLTPPVAVVLAVLLWWRQGQAGRRAGAGRYSIALIGLAAATALYYKKGLDRSDTAHFEQAAALAPVLIAALVSWAATTAEHCGRRGLPVVLFGGLACWLGLQQSVETYASHPSRLDIWGLQTPAPGSNLQNMPRAGVLRCSGEQVRPLQETLDYIHLSTRPEEPIYDFTNSGLWPFLAERPNAARYSQTFHALDDAMQQQVIADLEKNPPALVLFPDRPTAVDFVDLTLRQHRISAWLLQHYTPVAHVGYYLVLKTEASSGAAHPTQLPWETSIDATPYIGEQNQGFVPRALADQASAEPQAAGVPLTVAGVPVGGRLDLAHSSDLRGMPFQAPPDSLPWRIETTSADARMAIALPAGIQPGAADWLEIEMAVSGGTHGGIAFFPAATAGTSSDLAAMQGWWRQVRFRIEPTKQAAEARKYRFHLAALPNWMFLPGAVTRLEIQPTDTAGITVELRSVRFYKEPER